MSLRARHRRLRLPDARVLATGLHLRADRGITTNRGWPKAEVTIEVLR